MLGIRPRITEEVRRLLGWLRNFLGLFGVGSLVQDTLFLRDALSFIKAALNIFLPFVDQIAAAIASAIAVYRGLVAWLFESVGLAVPIIFVDVILALSLSHLVSKLIFFRSQKRIEQEMQSAFSLAAARQGLDLVKVKQDFDGMTQWERMRTAWQVMPGMMGGVVKAQYSLLLDPFILSVSKLMDRFVSALVIVGTLIVIFNIDTYYRLYMV